ncbi:TRM2 tRNA methyltransferase 2B [Cricetulus griseus]
MPNPRLLLSRVGFFSNPRLLPWDTAKPPDLSQSFLGRAHEGNFTGVIVTKHPRQHKYQKKQRHFISLHDSWQERLADVVTPLWRLSYEEQLKVKFEAQKKIVQTLESYLQVLHGVSGTVAAPHSEGLHCHLHPIIPSPIIDGYRNKSTFSVNRGPDGNPKTVGYYLGTWRGGHWRELTVRTNSQGHTMAIITFHPQGLSQLLAREFVRDESACLTISCSGQEELCAQKVTLKDFFTQGPGAVCELTSLYFQESTMTRCSHQQSPYQLLFGEPHIFEDLLGLKIRISPDAFFQINTAGAELLYQTIGELSGVNSNSILLDICCGTGKWLP